MSKNFYDKMDGFYEFSQVNNSDYYQDVPEGWYVVVADVKDSTKAIEAGRYKDINMSGVACIAAIKNCSKGHNIPFVFGGDGATFLIPEELLEQTQKVMRVVRKSIKKNYNLQMRIGFVPIAEINKLGKQFKVAKFMTSTGCSLAMFTGGGSMLADQLIKENKFNLDDDNSIGDTDLTGLSCRWQPIKAKKDVVMTLLVKEMEGALAHNCYEQVNTQIALILDGYGNPADNNKMKYTWPTLETFRHNKIVWLQGNTIKNILWDALIISLFNICHRMGWNIGSFSVQKFKEDITSNSDYRKFDDMLRMVIDCTKIQADEIKNYLENLRHQGVICYGIHYSKTALMTCFVETLDSDGHVHFIDGNDGGYAIAAQQLKSQMRG